MNIAFASAAVLLAFPVALVATRAVREGARRKHLLDHPNARSSHTVPVPRLGGLAIVVTFVAGSVPVVALAGAATTWVVLAATTGIAVLGLADDVRPVPARVRFALQAVVAMIVVVTCGPPRGSPWLAALPWVLQVPLLMLWIVWLTNLYNFMDGIDGLAGGQALIAGIAISLSAFAGGAGVTGWLALLLASASAGFLALNFPPASIFMGDVGSTTIGFFFACVPLLPGARAVPLEPVAIALSLFILDASFTLMRRMARGERWFEAHRTHYYQRPVALGVTHRTVTLVAYAAMVLVAAAAVAYERVSPGMKPMVAIVPGIVFAVIAFGVHALERRAHQDTAGAQGAR